MAPRGGAARGGAAVGGAVGARRGAVCAASWCCLAACVVTPSLASEDSDPADEPANWTPSTTSTSPTTSTSTTAAADAPAGGEGRLAAFVELRVNDTSALLSEAAMDDASPARRALRRGLAAMAGNLSNDAVDAERVAIENVTLVPQGASGPAPGGRRLPPAEGAEGAEGAVAVAFSLPPGLVALEAILSFPPASLVDLLTQAFAAEGVWLAVRGLLLLCAGTGCLPADTTTRTTSTSPTSASPSLGPAPAPSSAAGGGDEGTEIWSYIFGGAVGFGALLVLGMGLYHCHEKRRRNRAQARKDRDAPVHDASEDPPVFLGRPELPRIQPSRRPDDDDESAKEGPLGEVADESPARPGAPEAQRVATPEFGSLCAVLSLDAVAELVATPAPEAPEPESPRLDGRRRLRPAAVGRWVRRVYLRYNPSKLYRVDQLLEEYAGREEELLEAIEAKYQLHPKHHPRHFNRPPPLCDPCGRPKPAKQPQSELPVKLDFIICC